MTLPATQPRHSRESGYLQARLCRYDVLAGFAALLLAAATPAAAQPTTPDAPWAYKQLPDARQEAKARALMDTLRCLVCQGQSIADSDATMAGDMRSLVRERVAAGEEPEAVRAWLVERYGHWVSYKPSADPIAWPLWAAPVVLVALGAWLARGRFRKRQAKRG